MEATGIRLNKLLEIADEKFIIPIFQRKYSWTEKESLKLWNDIIEISKTQNDNGHFIGSLVCFELKMINLPGEIKEKILIDGQQRLTTLSLIMVAMMRVYNELGETYHKQANFIRKKYLINDEHSGEDKYKLVPTYEDKETYFALIDNMEHELKIKSKAMLQNFELFYDKLKSMSLEEISMIYTGINKLDIVYVLLAKGQDNPQLIFESMNSTGRGLTQGDLLRNYLLLDLDSNKQIELYEKYWKPIESDFGHDGYNERFDYFLRDYLMMKTKNTIRLDSGYEKFKELHDDSEVHTKENIIVSLRRYSKYYTNISLCKDNDLDLNLCWRELKVLRVDVANVFLIQLYNDYSNELITKKEFVEILKLIINYVYRRYICNIPTNSLSKTFLTLYNFIDKDDYLNSIKAFFINLDSYKKFPTDEEFKESFIKRDMYNTMLKNYTLENLENNEHLNGITIDGSNISIEHILPKGENLNKYWISMLGDNYKELQKEYVHRIGNLTITKGIYNSAMSNYSFKDKINVMGGIKDSHYRLSNDVIDLENWGIEEIKERSNRLANTALTIWKFPDMDKALAAKYLVRKQQEKQRYTDMNHYPIMNFDIKEIYEKIDLAILQIDQNIEKVFNKHYVAYKVDYLNFIEIVIYQKSLSLYLDIPHNLIEDSKDLSENIDDRGSWGTGNTRVKLIDIDNLEYILNLIKQSYNYIKEN